MNKETYERLSRIEYSNVEKQISDILAKYDPYKPKERGINQEYKPYQVDVIGTAAMMFFMKLGYFWDSIYDYDQMFEQVISEELNLHKVRMSQESLSTYYDELDEADKESVYAELKEYANRVDYDELVAFILFGDITEYEDYKSIRTPNIISRLASELLDIQKDEDVADFSFGEKNFVVDTCFRNPMANYYFVNMYEETHNVFYYLRFALLGIRVMNDIVISMDDTDLDNVLFDKVFFDQYVGYTEYRYSNSISVTNAEWNNAKRVMQLLHSDGKAVMIVPNVCTTTQKDIEARKYLVSNGYVEAVVKLPEKMYRETNASFTLLLLSHGNKSVTFIDASNEGEVQRNGAKRMNILSEEAIDKIVKAAKGESSFGEKASIQQILQKDSILSPNMYCTKMQVGNDGVELQELTKMIIRGVQIPGNELEALISAEPTMYRYLTPASIVDGRILEELPYLKVVEDKQLKYVANEGDLVISKNAEPFKVALVEHDNTLISSNMFKVELDTTKVDPLYLKGYLESEIGQAEFKKASSGGITTTLGIDALKKLQVRYLPMEGQQKIAEEYRKLSEEILEKQKEIEKLLDMRKSIY